MSEVAERWAKTHKKDPPPDEEEEKGAPGETRALAKLREEADARGSELSSDGEGGLPSSLVLGVMRRDGYRCKVCGRRGSKKNGGIGLHHKGGDTRSKWLSNKGHSNDPNNIVTICVNCHDGVHDRAREDGTDSSQVEPEGDA